jgi:hypothetical protein
MACEVGFAIAVPGKSGCCTDMGFKKTKRPGKTSPQLVVGISVACLLAVLPDSAMALFGSYLPLNISGNVRYNYGYHTTGNFEAERTNLIGTIHATGFIWQPWFASTSAALSVGLSKSDSSNASSDSTVTSGSFGLNVFPRSRFPFSLNYSRSDSRFQSYADQTQVAGEAKSTVRRLSLRQVYEGKSTLHSMGSRTSLWYSTTDFNSDLTQSKSEGIGADYHIRSAPHSLTISANQNQSETSNSSLKPKTQIVNITHNYLPGPDMGVTNLVSYVDSDSGAGTGKNSISQISSNFFWRPEHRLVHIHGGVRISDSRSALTGSDSKQKSLNTNLGLLYQMTRHLNMGASVAMGSSDSGGSQTLSTSESGKIYYNSSQIDLGGFNYHWQSGINASNSSSRVNTGTTETSNSIQTSGLTLGHFASKTWLSGNSSSLGLSLGQSGNVVSSSEENELIKGLNHSVGLSWNRRGHSGSIYTNLRYSDSRTRGRTDSDFQNFDASFSQDWIINRLSAFQGTESYTISRTHSVTSDVPGSNLRSEHRAARASFFYHHDRPFGVYNLRFTSRLTGSRAITGDSITKNTVWDWDNRFRYRLGLLDTSLSLRIIGSDGGTQTKTLYFQATRSF